MTILEELTTLFTRLGIPIQTGAFEDEPPTAFVVLTPLVDTFPVYGDDKPLIEVNEVRVSAFWMGEYRAELKKIVSALLAADFVISDRRFVEYESDTHYSHYAIDVQKFYPVEV